MIERLQQNGDYDEWVYDDDHPLFVSHEEATELVYRLNADRRVAAEADAAHKFKMDHEEWDRKMLEHKALVDAKLRLPDGIERARLRASEPQVSHYSYTANYSIIPERRLSGPIEVKT